MTKNTKFRLFLRAALGGSLLIVSVATLIGVFYADRQVTEISSRRFNEAANTQGQQIMDRLERYADLLYQSRAFLVAYPGAGQAAWDTFLREQNAFERYPGISTVSYLRFFEHDERQAFLNRVRAQPSFGDGFDIRPEGARDKYAVVELVSSDNSVEDIIGFDSYSGAAQRGAMDEAVRSGTPQATPPYELVTGFYGFVVFLPVYQNGELDGFSLLSFRGNDFGGALLGGGRTGLRYRITDTTTETHLQDIYRSTDWQDDADGLKRKDKIDVMGRRWEITFAANGSYNVSWRTRALPVAVMAVGVLVAGLLIMALILLNKAGGRLPAGGQK